MRTIITGQKLLSDKEQLMHEQLTIRETIPLVLLYESQDYEIEGRTRFQKMVFLIEKLVQNEEDKSLYEFVEYDYGPFSKQLLNDLERFEEMDVVDIDKREMYQGGERYDHQLTERGVKSVERLIENTENGTFHFVHDAAKDVIDEWGEESMWNLLDYIYESHPKYKERSVLY
jgi:uncharacterized protein YwgA